MNLQRGILISADHQLALAASLPFVHTARRCYRLSDLVSKSERSSVLLHNVGSGFRLRSLHLLRATMTSDMLSFKTRTTLVIINQKICLRISSRRRAPPLKVDVRSWESLEGKNKS